MDHPQIGSQEWLQAVPKHDQQEAQRLLAMQRPVDVSWTDEIGESGWAVIFEDSAFWADFFPVAETSHEQAKKLAEGLACAWNRQLSATVPAVAAACDPCRNTPAP